GLFFYNKIGSIISIGDLPTTNIIEPIFEEYKFEKGEGQCPRLLCFLVASFVKRVIIDCRIKGGIYERDSRIIY
ncbi:hypothetical protein V2O63_08510, partial [Streptococcus pneumoniae]